MYPPYSRPASLRTLIACLFVFSGLLYSFLGIAQPSISSFTPASANVGTVVTITGTQFNTTPGNNIVYFGPVRASVISSSATYVQVVVPSGATYAPITVTANSLTGWSHQAFIPKFPNGDSLSETSLAPRKSYQTGASPICVKLGDFDNDGRSDIVVASTNSNSISVYRNISSIGAISLSPKTDYVTGSLPVDLKVADIDGDGKQDIVVANDQSGHISVFRNTSDGITISFAPKIDINAGQKPNSIVLVDLNKDGKPEMATTSSLTGLLSVFNNTSTGTTISFAAPVTFTTATEPTDIGAADLDGDGLTDLAVTSYTTGTVSLFRNTGTPGAISLQEKVDVATANQPRSIAIGDLDGDGKPEITTASYGSSRLIAVLKNTSVIGQFSFAPKIEPGTVIENGAFYVELGDINGDGKPDLAVAGQVRNKLVLYENKSTESALSFSTQIDFPITNASPFHLAIGDLDGDNRPDVAVVNSATDTLSIFRNRVGDPTVQITSFSPTSAGSGESVSIHGKLMSDVTAVSFGGISATSFTVIHDTLITAVVGTGASGSIKVTTQEAFATKNGFNYTGPSIYSFTPLTGSVGSIITIKGRNFSGTTAVSFGGTTASSFNVVADSMITAIVGSGTTGNITVTTPHGTALRSGFIFTSNPTISSFTPLAGPAGTPVTISGMNFDPVATNNTVHFGTVKATVVTGSTTQLNVIVPAGATFAPISVTAGNYTDYSNRAFNITFPAGEIAFTNNSFANAVSAITGERPDNASVVDLDGDQKPDVVMVNNSAASNNFSIFRNTSTPGNISFAEKTDLNQGNNHTGVTAADLDGDGKPDLAVITVSGVISIFRNTSTPGNISFATQTDISTQTQLSYIATGDFNSDGKPDLAISNSFFKTVSIYINTSTAGSISFAPSKIFATGNGASRIAVSDLDGDRKVDMVLTNSAEASVTFFRNTSLIDSISFVTNGNYGTGLSPTGVKIGDLNNDGKPDIVIANNSSPFVSIFRNGSTPGVFIFTPMGNPTISGTPDQVDVAIADLNGDGKPDFVINRNSSGRLSVFKNITENSLILKFANPVEYAGGGNVSSVAAVDLDADGKPDLLSTSMDDKKLYALRNTATDAKVVPSGPSPVTNPVTNIVTVDSSVKVFNGTPYVRRHYDITPANNPATATATITLYFTQQDFNDFNAYLGNDNNLPAGPDDNAGKANLRIYQYHGFSASGLPGSYSGSAVIINPDDDKIIWNTNALTWEITFDVNGFSGFFLSNTAFKYITVPSPNISANGNTTFCQGGSVTLTSSATTGNQWYRNGTLLSGATANIYQATESGSYTVTASIGNVASTPSASVVVLVNPIPAKPIITVNGSELSSNIISGNQWYKNGSIINGEVNQVYKPTESSIYTVKVTANGCEGPMSDNFNFIATGIINIDNTHFIQISPNPVTDQTVLRFKLAGVNKLNIRIIDLHGKTVKIFENVSTGELLRIANLTPGVYIARVYSSKEKIDYSLKLLKQ